MSGFEVVGVVLGVIPLVLSAFERFEEGAAMYRNMRAYELVFRDLVADFSMSIAIYRKLVIQLLKPLNLSYEQENQLLSEHESSLWADLQLYKQLKVRLHPNHQAFLDKVEALNKKLNTLANKLELGDKYRAPWIMLDGTINEEERQKFFCSRWRKWNGGFRHGKYAKLLSAIDYDIDKISKYLGAVAPVEPMPTPRKHHMPEQWQNIQEHVRRIFDCIGSHSRMCRCGFVNRVNLRLSREGILNDRESRISLTLLVPFGHESELERTSWQWSCIQVRAAKPLHTTLEEGSITNTEPQHTSSVPMMIPELILPTEFLSSIVVSSPDIQGDLCKVLLEQHMARCSFEVSSINPNDLRQHQQHQIYSILNVRQIPIVTRSLLDIRNMPPRQKCTVALALATVVLQLYDNQWMSDSWDARLLSFLKIQDDTKSLLNLDISHMTTAAQTIQSRKNPWIRNQIVFALGIALIELSYLKPFADLCTSEDLNTAGVEDDMTPIKIAERELPQIEERDGANYADAVRRCITCNFSMNICELKDQHFRARFFDGVIAPLMADYDYLSER